MSDVLVVILLVLLLGSFGVIGRSREGAKTADRHASDARRAVVRLQADLDKMRMAEEERTEATTPVTPEERAALAANRCSHCGGVHARACPRVKRIQFRPDGGPLEVEFWPDAQWPKNGIVWPDDLVNVRLAG